MTLFFSLFVTTSAVTKALKSRDSQLNINYCLNYSAEENCSVTRLHCYPHNVMGLLGSLSPSFLLHSSQKEPHLIFLFCYNSLFQWNEGEKSSLTLEWVFFSIDTCPLFSLLLKFSQVRQRENSLLWAQACYFLLGLVGPLEKGLLFVTTSVFSLQLIDITPFKRLASVTGVSPQ